MSEQLVMQVSVLSLLVGIGLISFSTVGFSLRGFLEKQIWSGIPKTIFLVGITLTIISSITLLII
ncbi:MAG TPA: hypothetical protein VK121_09565 [Pseudogracilibacillus sp.]|nr:hypothetical protein [Pseudogracilibacillus sp.]